METELLFWCTEQGLQYRKFPTSGEFDEYVNLFEELNNIAEPIQVWNLYKNNKWYTNIDSSEASELVPVDSQCFFECKTPIPPEILAHALLLK